MKKCLLFQLLLFVCCLLNVFFVSIKNSTAIFGLPGGTKSTNARPTVILWIESKGIGIVFRHTEGPVSIPSGIVTDMNHVAILTTGVVFGHAKVVIRFVKKNWVSGFGNRVCILSTRDACGSSCRGGQLFELLNGILYRPRGGEEATMGYLDVDIL